MSKLKVAETINGQLEALAPGLPICRPCISGTMANDVYEARAHGIEGAAVPPSKRLWPLC